MYKGSVTMEVIEIVEEKLSMFKNLYDSIRIVDPIRKEVINEQEDKTKVVECNCYELWRKGEYCKNCISMRAFLENDTFLKIEFADGKPVLITASPVTIDNKTYIVEMIKNISQVESSVNSEKCTYNIEGLLKEINDVAIKDELTGIYNRRYINERLMVEIDNSITYNQPLFIIVTDIDLFKDVNDNYGHVVGDWILKDFAKLISSCIRSGSDWVGRYGGDEFLIVINNTDSKNAFNIVEKIRKVIEDRDFTYENIQVKITASFGAYSIINTTDMKLSVDELINKADRNLYLAKNSGRNKTVIS